jgi:histidinol phosphatase-like PHP family hydrolase
MLFDYHTHTILSDGELLPSELLRRYEVNNYKAVAITDHADTSNFEFVISSILKVCDDITRETEIIAIPGIEFTHVPPRMIESLVFKARKLGAKLVVLHGETPVEPVPEKTNYYGVRAGIDILAHPGFVDEETIKTAVERGVFLEISSRRGHSMANGHILKLARNYGFPLIVNSDAHSPSDIMDEERWRNFVLGLGVSEEELDIIHTNQISILKRMR